MKDQNRDRSPCTRGVFVSVCVRERQIRTHAHTLAGSGASYSAFSHNQTMYDLVVLGATVWGSSDVSGKPTSAHAVQLLVYFQEKDKACLSVHYARHCYLPPVSPPVMCRVRHVDTKWSHAYRPVNDSLGVNHNHSSSHNASSSPHIHSTSLASATVTKKRGKKNNTLPDEKANIPVDTVYCPLPSGLETLKNDQFQLELRMGDAWLRQPLGDTDTSKQKKIRRSVSAGNARGRVLGEAQDQPDEVRGKNGPSDDVTIVIDMCYEHVGSAAVVAICTQPQFLYSTKPGYWQGNPPYSNALGNYSLLDSFIMYHTRLMRTSVAIYDTESTLTEAMEPYRHRTDVVYRPHHGLYELQGKEPIKNPYAYQTHAEISCMWEHRFRAEWVFFLHSADCYVLPGNVGESLSSIMRDKVNGSEISEIRIPTVEAHSPETRVDGNVLKRCVP
jgi:hypothetical protein